MWLGDIALRSSIVVAAALAVTALVRHRSAAVRHWVLAAGIFSATAVLPLSLTLPAWALPVPASVASGAVESRPANEVIVRAEAPRPRSWPVTAVQALAIVWSAGAALSLGAIAVGYARLRRMTSRGALVTTGTWDGVSRELAVRFGLERQVALVAINGPAVLATWGLWKPKVLLPSQALTWNESRARIVLGHELAHIVRRDWAVQVAAELVRAVFWFNPLFWIACERLRHESDQACDDTVLETGVTADEYAVHLVDIARACRPSAAVIPAMSIARPSTLERRITAMLNRRLDRKYLSRRSRIAALAALLMLVAVPAATFRLSAQGTPLPLSGTVYDTTGAVLPQVAVTIEDPQSGRRTVTSDSAGRFEFDAVAPGRYLLEANLLGFQSLRYQIELRQPRNWERTLTMQVGTLEENITVTAQRPPSAVSPSGSGRRLEVGGNIRVPRKLVDVKPIYPESMRETGQEALVTLQAVIGVDGSVTSVSVLTTQVHPDFGNAAMDAVRQWRFSPTLLNGVAIDVSMKVTVVFSLN
jgi:TonB family protein